MTEQTFFIHLRIFYCYILQIILTETIFFITAKSNSLKKVDENKEMTRGLAHLLSHLNLQ